MAVLVDRDAQERSVGRRLRGRTTPRRAIGMILAYAALIALCAIVLLPLGWMLTVALKPDLTPVFTRPPEWLPTQHWQWDNFARALLDPERPFLRYTFNTLVIVGWNIVGTLLSCSLVAYAFARIRWRGRDLAFSILVITMLIPWQALLIPQFLLFLQLGWYGSILPLVVPSFFGNAFFIFLIRQYMRTIPRELELAAMVDGASRIRVFWHIVLPLSRPALAVCLVFLFLANWNDLLGPLIYLTRNQDFTVAIGMANLVNRQVGAVSGLNLLMAANLIMIIPAVLLYFFAQDKLIGGIASVGLKG
jgi:multiple sugar transport system permease protein